MKTRPFLFFMFIGIFLTNCRAPSFQNQTFKRPESERIIPYEVQISKKEEGKLVVILNDNPDTLQLKNSELSRYFFKKNYSVLIPRKPGDDFFSRQAMDNRNDRISDVAELVLNSDSLWKNSLVLIGFGEGGYAIPTLAKELKPTHSFIINAALLGPFSELETMAERDTTGKLEVLMARKNIRSREDLKNRLKNIQENMDGPQQIPPFSNYWWKSYGAYGLMQALLNVKTPTSWILSNDYLMISQGSIQQADMFAKISQQVQHFEIRGNGDFNDEGQMEVLMGIVESAVSKDSKP